MYSLAKSYNRDYYRNIAKSRVICRYRIFCIRLNKNWRILAATIASKLVKLAFKISPGFEKSLIQYIQDEL